MSISKMIRLRYTIFYLDCYRFLGDLDQNFEGCGCEKGAVAQRAESFEDSTRIEIRQTLRKLEEDDESRKSDAISAVQK